VISFDIPIKTCMHVSLKNQAHGLAVVPTVLNVCSCTKYYTGCCGL